MLIDMKLSKADKAEEKKKYSVGQDSMPDYPYGLSLTIDKDELDKLGMTEYEVGDELNISAVGKVTMVRNSADEKSEESSITIQITKLELKDADEMAEAVEAKGSAKTTLTNAMR